MSVDYTDPNVWKQAQEQAGLHGKGTPGSTPSGAPPPAPNNAKRVILAGCFGAVILIVAFVGAILFFIFGSLRSNDAVKAAVARADQNPQVIAALGQPLTVGYVVTGSIDVSGTGGNADLIVPVSGPKGNGTIYLTAVKRAGKWEFKQLEIEIEGHAGRIDLLQQNDKVY